VLAGEQDILIPTDLSHDLQSLVPGAEWRTVAGGHGCVWEHPDDINAAFLAFLQNRTS
jgi:3-oxoadipate enol-lactonase